MSVSVVMLATVCLLFQSLVNIIRELDVNDREITMSLDLTDGYAANI